MDMKEKYGNEERTVQEKSANYRKEKSF